MGGENTSRARSYSLCRGCGNNDGQDGRLTRGDSPEDRGWYNPRSRNCANSEDFGAVFLAFFIV